MRRWTLLLAGAALWLFLAAVPALADGGPHVAAANSGASTLTADSCAGCHRAHTAQGAMLLKTDEAALCLTCHGTLGAGATANVEDGVQYAAPNDGTGAGAVAGALRGGGFVFARIDSSNPVRLPLPRWDSGEGKYVTSFSSRVPPAASGTAVTSAHLKLTGANGVTLQGTTWGNGALNSGVGPSLALECASCHNPHGNGQYRILNPIPSDGTGPLVEAGTAANVAEMRTAASVVGTRNYTVQWGSSLATIVAGTGDYWRRYQPYNIVPQIRADFNPAQPASSSSTCVTNPVNNGTTVNCPVGYPAGYFAGDAPEFVQAGNAGATVPAAATTWRTQISAWCSTCHTRYLAPSGSYQTPSGDAIFNYRHPTTSSLECTKCHVAHGSNALMPGDPALGTNFSGDYSYPVAAGGTAAHNGSSRLLKVDNRGTCQQCHDPTKTIPYPTTTFP